MANRPKTLKNAPEAADLERLPPGLRQEQAAEPAQPAPPPAPVEAAQTGAKRPPFRLDGTQMFLLSCMAFVVGFLVWSAVGRLDVVANALGEVVPASQVQSVQHLEGGIVRAILVQEGDRVTRDQALIELEPTRTDAELEELNIRMTALRVSVARLEGEATGAESLSIPKDIREAEPQITAAAEQLFQTRQRRLSTQLKSQQEQINQRQAEIREANLRIANNSQALKFLAEQTQISQRLLNLNLTNRMKHLDLLKEQSERRGKIAEDQTLIKRLESGLAEAQQKLLIVKTTFQEEARKELEEVKRTLRELQQRRLKLADAAGRTVLRSPVNGVVKTLYVVTEGGVIQAGRTVVDIVPGDDRLIVEARLQTQDIGYVRAGQKARVSLTSADAQRFGHLDATVIQVSPDTFQTKEGQPYYKVRIETKRDRFAQDGLEYRLFPGMQVSVSILTGTRTVLAYILDPYVKSMRLALRER